MKNLILAVAFVLISGLTFAQNRVVIERSHPSGGNQLNLGVGLSEWGIPIYIGFDHYVSQDVTLGAEFSYRNYNNYHWNNYYYDRSIMGFSGNANYHFNSVLNIPSNWDFYAGLNIGFYTYGGTEPINYDGPHNSGLSLGGQIGGRYYLSNRVGLNLEFGGNNAFRGGKFGLTIKI